MNAMLWSWVVAFAVVAALAAALGWAMDPRRPAVGILIDSRGRYSLTHFQLVIWSLVILPLIAGVFFGRWIDRVQNPLEFTVPGTVLGLLGISVGSFVTSTAVKAAKNVRAAPSIAASGRAASGLADEPRLAQIFLQEEGPFADQVIDLAKFQNFVFTVVLVVAYIALSVHALADASSAAAVTTLPTFSGTFLILVGISQGGYVINKLTPAGGPAPGMTMANRSETLMTFTPRNAGRAAAPGASTPRRPSGLDLGALLPAHRRLAIARRASGLARQSPGRGDLENWLDAEREVDAALGQVHARAHNGHVPIGTEDPVALWLQAEAELLQQGATEWLGIGRWPA